MVLALAVVVLATMGVAVVLAMMVVAAVLAAVAVMEIGFSSQSPPQLPGAKHPTLAPARLSPSMRYVVVWQLR